MNAFMKKFAPPGARFAMDCALIGVYMLILLVMIPAINFDAKLSYLQFDYSYTMGSDYSDINQCLSGCLFGMWIILIVCIVQAASYYRSFMRPSRSIYLMKRVENPLELHVRCLTYPLAMLLLGVIISSLMLWSFKVKFLRTPGAVNGEINLWRALI